MDSADTQLEVLKKILDEHADLAVCYAMKEELVRLFTIRAEDSAREGRTAWFKGAEESGIPALVRFAELKEKRLEGLIAHVLLMPYILSPPESWKDCKKLYLHKFLDKPHHVSIYPTMPVNNSYIRAFFFCLSCSMSCQSRSIL